MISKKFQIPFLKYIWRANRWFYSLSTNLLRNPSYLSFANPFLIKCLMHACTCNSSWITRMLYMLQSHVHLKILWIVSRTICSHECIPRLAHIQCLTLTDLHYWLALCELTLILNNTTWCFSVELTLDSMSRLVMNRNVSVLIENVENSVIVNSN